MRSTPPDLSTQSISSTETGLRVFAVIDQAAEAPINTPISLAKRFRIQTRAIALAGSLAALSGCDKGGGTGEGSTSMVSGSASGGEQCDENHWVPEPPCVIMGSTSMPYPETTDHPTTHGETNNGMEATSYETTTTGIGMTGSSTGESTASETDSGPTTTVTSGERPNCIEGKGGNCVYGQCISDTCSCPEAFGGESCDLGHLSFDPNLPDLVANQFFEVNGKVSQPLNTEYVYYNNSCEAPKLEKPCVDYVANASTWKCQIDPIDLEGMLSKDCTITVYGLNEKFEDGPKTSRKFEVTE